VPLSTFSFRRPLSSYAKVQALAARLIRNRRFQLRRPRVQGCAYLDVGCGHNTHAEYINLEYAWHPGIDVCWDIRTGLPFANGALRGVFSEHCLEHFPLPEAGKILREMRRVLAPGGTVRLVVPDGELYLRTYVRHLAGDTTVRFPYEEAERAQPGWTPMVSVNRVFYQDRESLFGHSTIYDFQLMEHLLRTAGFEQVTRRRFGEGCDPRLLIDTPARQCESLYVEATVGSAAP
jgi:SAM-dependent methyltransferase